MRLWGVLAVVGALLAVCGCGPGRHLPSPYRVGLAQPGPPIHVAGVERGVANGVDWPNACMLLSDDELRAVLPQIDHVDRLPNDKTVNVWVSNGGNPLAASYETAVANADCQYQVTFKFDDNGGGRGDGSYLGTVAVDDLVVGSPDTVELNWNHDLDKSAGQVSDIAGLPCQGTAGDNSLACKSGSFYYGVGVTLDSQYGKDADKPVVRLDVAGKIQEFPRTGSLATAEENDAVRTAIVTKFAETLNAKLR